VSIGRDFKGHYWDWIPFSAMALLRRNAPLPRLLSPSASGGFPRTARRTSERKPRGSRTRPSNNGPSTRPTSRVADGLAAALSATARSDEGLCSAPAGLPPQMAETKAAMSIVGSRPSSASGQGRRLQPRIYVETRQCGQHAQQHSVSFFTDGSIEKGVELGLASKYGNSGCHRTCLSRPLFWPSAGPLRRTGGSVRTSTLARVGKS
jgi:hypothetical protein